MRSTKSQNLRTLQRALRLVWQGAPGWTLVGILLLPIQALLATLPLYYSKLIVDAVTISIRAPHITGAFRSVAYYIGLQVGLAILGAGMGAVAAIARTRQAAQFCDYITEIIHAKAIEVDLQHYEDARYYDMMRRVQGQIYSHPINIVNNLLASAQNILSLGAIVGLLVSLHWMVGALLFIATLPSAIVNMNFSRQMYHWQRNSTKRERQSYYLASLMTQGDSAKEIRLFQLGPLLLQRMRALRAQIRRERLGMEARNTLVNLGAQSIATLAVYASYAYAAYCTWQGRTTLGGLTMYFAAFQRGQGMLQQTLASLGGLYESSLFLADLEEFLDIRPCVREPEQPRPVPGPMQSGVRFEEVGFLYPGSDRVALDNVSLTIRPGEMIALVGENGSGKTTLTKLLCRLYDPTCGRITVDGVDLRGYSLEQWRSQISVIFQDYQQYQLSARENIWFGNIATPPDTQQIETVARLCGADAVIQELPEGYDTVLGRLFEGGAELSIGQWQKIALARAFLRDAQIIVLDEPTSAMDARAEYEFFRDFRRLAQGRATILISHRFSTVRMADCIYVLEDGVIAESGSHDDLVQRGGKYAQLFEMQAQHYR